MSTSPATARQETTLSEEDVVAFLQGTPDFFERHADLLSTLRLPHASGGAVSLVERQIEVLREKNQAADARLAELVSIARSNEQLAVKIHQFTRRLMRAPTRRAILTEIETGFRDCFDITQTVLLLFNAGTNTADLRFVRAVAPSDPQLAGFETLLTSGRPRCGQVRDTQREFIFGADSNSVGSVALVPLSTIQGPLGLLVLGSLNNQRFHPGMSTEFLTLLGESISDALARD